MAGLNGYATEFVRREEVTLHVVGTSPTEWPTAHPKLKHLILSLMTVIPMHAVLYTPT